MFLICTKHTNKKNWSSNLGSVEETMDLSCILLTVPFLRNPSEVEIIQLQRILTYFFLCLEALHVIWTEHQTMTLVLNRCFDFISRHENQI